MKINLKRFELKKTYSFYLSRKSCAEHDDLFVRSAIVDDSHDLRFESHVKKPVGLVQNEVSDSTEICDATGVCCKHVDHASRCADDNFRSSLQLSDLLGYAGATVNADSPKVSELF